jgi:hypothetical protein
LGGLCSSGVCSRSLSATVNPLARRRSGEPASAVEAPEGLRAIGVPVTVPQRCRFEGTLRASCGVARRSCRLFVRRRGPVPHPKAFVRVSSSGRGGGAALGGRRREGCAEREQHVSTQRRLISPWTVLWRDARAHTNAYGSWRSSAMTFLEQCDRFLEITRGRPSDTWCVSHGDWHRGHLALGEGFGRGFAPAAEAVDGRREHRVVDLPRLRSENARHLELTCGAGRRALSGLRRAA